VSEPGDRASKRLYWGEPTHSDHADGHGEVPNNVDLEPPLPPGSKSSARSHMSHAREPGDLEGAGDPMEDRWHGREGDGRNPQQSFEESDARTVPTCKKSANSWVTCARGTPRHPSARSVPREARSFDPRTRRADARAPATAVRRATLPRAAIRLLFPTRPGRRSSRHRIRRRYRPSTVLSGRQRVPERGKPRMRHERGRGSDDPTAARRFVFCRERSVPAQEPEGRAGSAHRLLYHALSDLRTECSSHPESIIMPPR
jgi:hypothetical protein